MALKHRAVLIAVATVAVLLTMWHFHVDFIWPAVASCILVAVGAAMDRQSVHGGGFLNNLFTDVANVIGPPGHHKARTLSEFVSNIDKKLKADTEDFIYKEKCHRDENYNKCYYQTCNTQDRYHAIREAINNFDLDRFREFTLSFPLYTIQKGFFNTTTLYLYPFIKNEKDETVINYKINYSGIVKKELANDMYLSDLCTIPKFRVEKNYILHYEQELLPVNPITGLVDAQKAPTYDYWKAKFIYADMDSYYYYHMNDLNTNGKMAKTKIVKVDLPDYKNMSSYQRVIILRDPAWQTFNVATMSHKHLQLLKQMHKCAQAIARIDSEKLGLPLTQVKLYFRCWPYVNTNILFAYVLDVSEGNTTPAFTSNAQFLLPFEEVEAELENSKLFE